MYNASMKPVRFEIRICNTCGLRYPMAEGNAFGVRCPACMGETRLILRRQLIRETEPALPESLPLRRKKRDTSRAVLLDNIRSAWNVGSILRTAEGFGFAHAYCCGITPTPENQAVTKTSLGAEEWVTWSYHKDAVKLIKGLKQNGWKVYALEGDARAIPLKKKKSTGNAVLIVGNEVTGVDPELLDLCDAVYYIPMRGAKKSFNAAIAFGIAAFALG
jgi:23S rRNA (guanosine2251-2'-O)-methyltransferase